MLAGIVFFVGGNNFFCWRENFFLRKKKCFFVGGRVFFKKHDLNTVTKIESGRAEKMALTHDIVAALQTQREIDAVRDLVVVSQMTSFDRTEMQNRVIYVHTPGLPNQAMEVILTPIRIRCPVSMLHMCARNIGETYFNVADDQHFKMKIQTIINKITSVNGSFDWKSHTFDETIIELGEAISLWDNETLDFDSVYTCKQLVKEIEFQPFHVKVKAYKMGKGAKMLLVKPNPYWEFWTALLADCL